MSRNESIRQATIRKTGNDLMNVWTEDARVLIQWYEGGYSDDNSDIMKKQLSPSAAERLSDKIESDSLRKELKNAAGAARREWYTKTYVSLFPDLFEDY